jgi:hypothetical protein
MSQVPPFLDPWKLLCAQPFIDCRSLAAAIEQVLERYSQPDFRTRLVVRDSDRKSGTKWQHFEGFCAT